MFGSVEYPSSMTLYLPAIKEKVPVYTKVKFRISQEVNVNTSGGILGFAREKTGKSIPITGKL